jgi:Leucine-rich repeat (LRR) protein
MYIDLATGHIIPVKPTYIKATNASPVVRRAMTHGTDSVAPSVWDVLKAQSPKKVKVVFPLREDFSGKLPPQLWELTSLEELTLLNAGLNDDDLAPLWAGKLPNLRRVRLGGNNIVHVPHIEREALVELVLYNNAIESLAGFHCPNLATVDLCWNKELVALPEEVTLPRLRNLSVEQTGVTRISAAWLSNLTQLSITGADLWRATANLHLVVWHDEETKILLKSAQKRGCIVWGMP